MTEEKKPDEAPKKKTRRKKEVFTDDQLTSPRTQAQFRLALRRSCRMYYDIQEMRLQALGRLTKKAPGADIELHPRDLAKLQARLGDLEVAEKNMLSDLEDHLNEVPFYKDVMLPQRGDKYRGLGPRMASVILSSFDIHKEDTVSKMWAFAGLRPIPCKRCAHCFVQLSEADGGLFNHPSPPANKCRFKGGIVSVEETVDSAKAQRPIPGEKLAYNAWLRSKLCGVLGEVLLKVGSPYRKFYDDYKHRWASSGKGTSDAHRHKAAIRYMIKMLLLDIWREWRTFEKLPVRGTYQEEYLKHTHKTAPKKETIIKEFNPLDVEVEDELRSMGLQ